MAERPENGGAQNPYDSADVLIVKRAFANPAGAGDNAVVAAVTGKKIRVLSCHVHAAGAVSVIFRSNTTAISATYALAANGGFVKPHNKHGWFQTAAGEALNLNLGGAVATGVEVTYVEV